MTPPANILLVRPSALGDVCRTVPVLVSLARRFSEAKIDWLVQTGFEDAVAAHPDLRCVIPFDRRGLSLGRLWTPGWWGRMRRLVHDLRSPGYDLVVDCQGLWRSGLFARLTGAGERVGYANAAELGWIWLNRRVRVPREMHTVDRMLALVDGAGAPAVRDLRLYVSERHRSEIDPRLRGARFAVVAPTSRWPGKRWPADRFAAVVEAMLSDGVLDAVALVAGPSERDQCAPLLTLAGRDPRVVDLIGRTSVGDLMAAIEASRLVLANDSAALHMAVGLDRPMVGLFGPTRIDRVGPYARRGDVIQATPPGPGVSHKDDAAGRALMERIGVEPVRDAVLARLAGQPAPGGAHERVRSAAGP